MDRVNNYFWVREHPADELEWLRAERVDAAPWPRPLVLVTGAFDMLHCGHMRLLFAARERAKKGTVLCAMDSDRYVADTHGPGRPIMNWIERSTALSYMPIDYICEVDSSKELEQLANNIVPDYFVTSTNSNEYLTGSPWLRKAFVRSAGMHTSELIQRCVESYERTKYR